MTTWTKVPQIPTNRTTMDRCLRHEPKMNRVQVNHPIIDSKRESEVLKKSKTFTSKPQIQHQSKNLIGVNYMRIVWNYILRQSVIQKRKRGWGNDIPTYGKRVGLGQKG